MRKGHERKGKGDIWRCGREGRARDSYQMGNGRGRDDQTVAQASMGIS